METVTRGAVTTQRNYLRVTGPTAYALFPALKSRKIHLPGITGGDTDPKGARAGKCIRNGKGNV